MDYIEKTLFATSCDAFANMKVSNVLIYTRAESSPYAFRLDRPSRNALRDTSRWYRVTWKQITTRCVGHMIQCDVMLRLLTVGYLISVLYSIQSAHPLTKLCHQTSISQTPRRNFTGQEQLQHHDALHCECGKSSAYYEYAEG